MMCVEGSLALTPKSRDAIRRVRPLDGPNRKAYAVAWLGSTPNREIARRVSSSTYVRAGLPPILTIQGNADPTVPYSRSLRLREALNKAGVDNELITIPGGKHGRFTPEERVRIYAGVRQFLEKHGLPTQVPATPTSSPAPNADSATGSTPQSLRDFTGNWKNTEPETRGLTTIQIRRDGNHAFVHTWGRCHPTDCDWGETRAALFAPDVSSHAVQAVSAVDTTSFSETRLLLRPGSGQTLQIDSYTHFTDKSGRSDYAASYRFRREP